MTGLSFELTEEQEQLRQRSATSPTGSARGIPEEYGGQGGDLLDQTIVCEELSCTLGGLAWLRGITVWSERVMVAAMCTGILQAVLEDAVAYASQRHAFGKPIGQMQAIKHGIADIAMKLETA